VDHDSGYQALSIISGISGAGAEQGDAKVAVMLRLHPQQHQGTGGTPIAPLCNFLESKEK
jgi:hypothetical protein